MALVVFDRVQETTATTGTGTITLGGAVTGFQSFAVIGNGNTTFYCITNGAQWEVGIGTYSTTGPTLARTTVLSNSDGNTSPITLVGASNVFVTYPSEKSVNLDASGNVTALGTVTSGVWNGTTIPVAYGGTGVTASSGANSVVLRDANQNIAVNSVTQNLTKTVSAGGTTVLTLASSHFQVLTGTQAQTYQLPDATSLPTGTIYVFDNDSTQNLTIVDNASGTVDVVAAGGYTTVFLEANGTVAGEWGRFGMIPAEVNWGTNSLALGGSTIVSGGTWQGNPVAYNYGGTGLTTFTAANNALYSTSASALTAGTLPVAAGGTGATTLTSNGVLYGTGTTAISATAVGSTGQVLVGNTGAAPSWATVSSSLVSSFSAGTTGFTPSTATTGAVTLAGTLGVANGGTGTSTAFTAGSVVFAGASGTYSQDNAQLFWDDTNNRLGIGVTPTLAKLHISSSVSGGEGVYVATTGAGGSFTGVSETGPILDGTSGGLTLSNLTSTDGSSSGLNAYYYKVGGSPLAGDSVALLRFFGESSTLASTEYGRITTLITVATNGSQTGELRFGTFNSTAITNSLRLLDNSQAFLIGAYTSTTASAANVFVASSGLLSRSTSSIQYKTQVEDLAAPNSANIYNMRPVWYRSLCATDNKKWSYYGLIAEEVANLDPRLVHWGYADDQYNITYVENDGQKEEVKTLKENAVMQPEGVQYDRLTVLLIQEMKALKTEVESLKAEVQVLKAQ